MSISLFQLLSVILFCATGVFLFLLLLNRSLLILADSKVKNPVILLAALTLIGGGCVAGFYLARPPWIFIPLGVFGLLVIGEIRELYLRRLYRGSPPVDTLPHRVSITAPITTTDLMVHRYEVSLSKVIKPLRIVHITDIHADQRFPWDYYRNALDTAASFKPDIAVFTGDFISHIKALPCLKEILRPIATTATYAVLGNHDYWVAPEAIADSLRASGIHVLNDETHLLTIDKQTLAITGYDFPWGTQSTTIPVQATDQVHIVLTHTPDNIYRLAHCKADLVFAGHYHAGQVRLPLRGSIVVPSIYGCRFDHGHFIVDQTHLFVASGIGASYPPVRIYCQPDIFVVDILPCDQLNP
jgi:predicted MPP superfamily phosphohydrolase